jgi:hypothetical protein
MAKGLTSAERHGSRALLAPDEQVENEENGEAHARVQHGSPKAVALPAVSLEHAEQPCRLCNIITRHL